jgi:hypothetical protein
MLGAPYSSPDALRKAAEVQVAEVQARVAALNQSGALKDVNRAYRAYRLAQIEKCEKAMPYSAFLERRTATILRNVAATGRMV